MWQQCTQGIQNNHKQKRSEGASYLVNLVAATDKSQRIGHPGQDLEPPTEHFANVGHGAGRAVKILKNWRKFVKVDEKVEICNWVVDGGWGGSGNGEGENCLDGE